MTGEVGWLGQTGYLTLTSSSEKLNVNQGRIIVVAGASSSSAACGNRTLSSSPEHHHHQSHLDPDIIVIIDQPG